MKRLLVTCLCLTVFLGIGFLMAPIMTAPDSHPQIAMGTTQPDAHPLTMVSVGTTQPDAHPQIAKAEATTDTGGTIPAMKKELTGTLGAKAEAITGDTGGTIPAMKKELTGTINAKTAEDAPIFFKVEDHGYGATLHETGACAMARQFHIEDHMKV